MEFFGITKYGPSDPIKDMMRDDYREPLKQENLLKLAEEGKIKKSFTELIKELDVYSGFADGYAYSSMSRLQKLRMKGCFKPVGPIDMYKYPTSSMACGWWHGDPALSGDWYRPRQKFEQPLSEMSRYFNACLTIDKFFKL